MWHRLWLVQVLMKILKSWTKRIRWIPLKTTALAAMRPPKNLNIRTKCLIRYHHPKYQLFDWKRLKEDIVKNFVLLIINISPSQRRSPNGFDLYFENIILYSFRKEKQKSLPLLNHFFVELLKLNSLNFWNDEIYKKYCLRIILNIYFGYNTLFFIGTPVALMWEGCVRSDANCSVK